MKFTSQGGSIDGPAQVAPGFYHVTIISVDPQEEEVKKPMIFKYQIVAGKVKDDTKHDINEQIGSNFTDYIGKHPGDSGNGLMRFYRLLIATKMTTAEQLKTMQENDQEIEIDNMNVFVGRQMVIELTEEKYQEKIRTKCGFGMYALDDERVKDIPKNEGMIQQMVESIKNAGNTSGNDGFNAGSGGDGGSQGGGSEEVSFF
jgi:hypothetical protein